MSDKKPMVLVFAGPNGSGKSTISEYLEIVGTYTNADAMVSATGMATKKQHSSPIKCVMLRLMRKRILHLRLCFRPIIS